MDTDVKNYNMYDLFTLFTIEELKELKIKYEEEGIEKKRCRVYG